MTLNKEFFESPRFKIALTASAKVLFYAIMVISGMSLLGFQAYSYADYGLNLFLVGTALALLLLALLFAVAFRSLFFATSSCVLTLGLPLICGFAFFMLPFAPPDEFTHVNRVFDNRGADEIFVPNQLPMEYCWLQGYRGFAELLAVPFSYDDVRGTDFSASRYLEVCYFIPATVMHLGRLLNINGFLMIFVCRFANGLVYLLAAFWIVKTIPWGQRTVLVFLFNPLLLQQEVSVSADVLSNIGSLCLVAQIIRMIALQPEKISPWNWLQLIGLMLIVALCKYVYLVLALGALLLIPKVKNRTARIALLIVLCVGAILAVLLVLAMGYGDFLIKLLSKGNLQDFISSLINTIVEQGGFYFSMLFGSNLGWPYMNSTAVPGTVLVPYVWIAYAILLAVAFVADSSKAVAITHIQRYTLLFLSFATGLLTFVALWHYMPVAVEHYQSRYLIPPFFMGLLALTPRRDIPLNKVPPLGFASVAFCLAIIDLLYVIRYFTAISFL